MDYLEKEYQENPLIDFDRRVFNKEGVSFEEDLSDIENNAVKESLQDHLLQQTGFLSKRFYQIYAADGTDGGICKKPAGMYGASAAGIGIKI